MQRLAPEEAEIFVPQLNEKRRIKTTFCKVKKHGVRKPHPCGALIIFYLYQNFFYGQNHLFPYGESPLTTKVSQEVSVLQKYLPPLPLTFR